MKNKITFGILSILLTVVGVIIYINLHSSEQKNIKYVTEESYKKNLLCQEEMTHQVFGKLKQNGNPLSKELNLKWFFHTNCKSKAKDLIHELKNLSNIKDPIINFDDKVWVISGWTTKMFVSDSIVVSWTSDMCKLGYKNDCEFEGFKIFPNQN